MSNINLAEIVAKKVKAMSVDGSIEKAIQENVEIAINEALDSALSYNTELRETIGNAVKESINIKNSQVSLPEYSTLIVRKIQETYSKVMEETDLNRIEKLVKSQIKPAPTSAKISDLNKVVIQCWEGYARDHDGEIRIDFEDEEHGIFINFYHPEDDSKIRVTLYDHGKEGEYKIGYLSEDDTALSAINPAKSIHSGDFSSLSDALFKYYIAQTVFEIDEELTTIYLDSY